MTTSVSIRFTLLSILIATIVGCGKAQNEVLETSPESSKEFTLQGTWVTEQSGQVMADPQPSGLIMLNGQLVTVSDASALPEQQRKLHFIDPSSGVIQRKTKSMSMSSAVRKSCFAQYLTDEPDFEALVVDPSDPTVFILVTEDATRTGALSPHCQSRFNHTGSTAYPTLLVRLKMTTEYLIITHVRPLQYPVEFGVGDFPNDGIEAMAFGNDQQLYLGLEKDAAGQPRIFSVTIEDDFWQETGFVPVQEPKLRLPTFTSGNHPINGMDYLPIAGHPGVLMAAARNDNQLWLIDLAAKVDPQLIDLVFEAPTLATTEQQCAAYELMDNSSLEGVAVADNTVWLINDPWKRNYLKNLQCLSNQPRYEAMAPLLFSVPIQAEWLAPYSPAN